MIETDVLIVGGGPAGSTCGWQLKRLGIDCLILDKETFPRTKLCAGWITPEVVSDLEIDISNYPHRFLSFHNIHFHFPLLGTNTRTLQHSIRRYEFDDWLLKRAGVPIHTHDVRRIRRDNDHYIIDDRYRCKYLVGAGGTRCPVYRELFRRANPRAKALQAVTLEQEFAYDYQEQDCHLWFLEHRLPGYSWYVPKQDGYINVGIGAMANKLKARDDDIKPHWQRLTTKLQRLGYVRDYDYKPKGYSYFVRGNVEVGRIDNAFIVGDAAGLATRDMCEGIGPAVRSALMAARSIAEAVPYDLASISGYSSDSKLARTLLDFMFH
ncbi:MAG: geranylgeranyl reductase [Gammaproteobacteria bacterium SG8_47]|nr:MAG: geranylgeranyl reductase [Gammaproteobacteria bacterium SG8_47]